MRNEASEQRAATAGLGDSLASALSLDDLVQRVDPDVVSALARWREVDPLSLHGLGSALLTRGSDAAIDHVQYLTALHGFVAERITYDALASHNNVILPPQTNVPAYDLIVNGDPVQVKEGTTAYDTVQRALRRYPEVNHFATDTRTAAELKARGIDAVGIPGLEPDRIARETSDSLIGLSALQHAGEVHVPILTTVFALCRYWERFDSGRIDARTAAVQGAVDIGAQALGSALGIKLAAIYVVAAGGFGWAALPLTAGAIVGALGLRHLVSSRRMSALRTSLAAFETTRVAAEQATQIIIEISRTYADKQLDAAHSKIEKQLAVIDAQWSTARIESAYEAIKDLDSLCVAALREADSSISPALERRLLDTRGVVDPLERASKLYKLLRLIVRTLPLAQSDLFVHLNLGQRRSQQRAKVLQEKHAQLQHATEKVVVAEKHNLYLELAAEYALLLERLSQIAARVIADLQTVRLEAEKIGADWPRLAADTRR